MTINIHKPTGKPYHVAGDGTHYHPETAPAVIEVLQRLRKAGTRVRLFYGDTATGKAWTEEYNVTGRLFRTGGTVKSVGLLATSASSGGPLILEHCVVAIITGPDQFAYKHPSFDPGRFEQVPPVAEGYAEAVAHGEPGGARMHAQFKKAGAAARYIAFMTGRRMCK